MKREIARVQGASSLNLLRYIASYKAGSPASQSVSRRWGSDQGNNGTINSPDNQLGFWDHCS